MSYKIRSCLNFKYLCVLLFLFVPVSMTFGQTTSNEYDQQGVFLPYFSRLHSNFEFYNFNPNEDGLYWVTNAKLNLSQRDFINIELIGVYHQKGGETIWTPGDFNLTYTRDFMPASSAKRGWQGLSASTKLVMPTGKPGYAGLFGHWILEPAIQYSWRLSDERFFISNKWRYNFPLANTADWSEPPIFIRFEPQFGYQGNRWSASLTMDNRMVYNRDAFVIFTRLDAGYKLSSQMGVSAFYTRRVRHTELFNTYAGIGLYYNF